MTPTILLVNKSRLIQDINETAHGHHYAWGGKPALGLEAGQWSGADCSGYTRWWMYNCAGVKLPEGSVQQREWCEKQGFKRVTYAEVAELHDSRLRLAFIPVVNPDPPATQGHPGHVVGVINGLTIECYGGHGPGRRPWNTKILLNEITACFVLTEPLLA